jgi:hypothetical protein
MERARGKSGRLMNVSWGTGFGFNNALTQRVVGQRVGTVARWLSTAVPFT